jgi:outer membrane protein
MMQLKHIAFSVLILLVAATGYAQSGVWVVDFRKAIVGTVEGKKAQAELTAKFDARRTDLEKKQKELEDKQNQLKTQDRVLSASAKADIQRDIDHRTTELQRTQEDAQKELDALQDQLLGPIVDIARRALNALASDKGYTVVIDISMPDTNVVFVNKSFEITDELIKRIDAALAAMQTAPAATPPATPPAAAGQKPN